MSSHAGMSFNRVAVLAAGIAFSVLLAGCANRSQSSPPVAEISGPARVKVAYQGAACNRLAPQLVSLARQEHELSSTSGKGRRSASPTALADTRKQKEEIRTEMRQNGCF